MLYYTKHMSVLQHHIFRALRSKWISSKETQNDNFISTTQEKYKIPLMKNSENINIVYKNDKSI